MYLGDINLSLNDFLCFLHDFCIDKIINIHTFALSLK